VRRTLLPVLAALALGVAACGSSSDKQPAASAFAAGTCRAAAPDVLSIGSVAKRLGDKVSPEARTALREAQSRLSTLAEAAEPSYKPSLDALVVSAGFVRIRADGNTYDRSLGTQLMTDYRAVVKACTSA
jgi:predicted outer membrane protein